LTGASDAKGKELMSYSAALRFDAVFLSCAFAFLGAVLLGLF